MRAYKEQLDDGVVLVDNEGNWWMAIHEDGELWLRMVSKNRDHHKQIVTNDDLRGYRVYHGEEH